MTYNLVQMGCQMNRSDAERIRTVLERMGFEETQDEESADVLGVVACSVRQKSIDKVYSRGHKWSRLKQDRKRFTFLSGCVLPADRRKLKDRFDLLFDITELPRLPYLFAERMTEALPTTGFGPGAVDYYWQITPSHTSDFEAFVPIQNGCNKFCTFCAVPYTRGREISRPADEIVTEVAQLVQGGARSITLLGQNVNSYGAEGQGTSRTQPKFAALLERLGSIPPFGAQPHWIYFTSPHPKDMGEDVLEVMAGYPTIANQIHLPLQSGDDEVLRRMNRGYTVAEYLRLVEKIRECLPDATLFTDVIVGFTGETEKQFEGTLDVMKEVAFDMAYIAMYSPRPGASSARWEDDVPHPEKRKRLHRLSEVLRKGSLRRNKLLIGRTVPALVEGPDRKAGYVSGRTEGLQIVRLKGDVRLIGKQVSLKIEKAAPLSMEGRLADVLS